MIAPKWVRTRCQPIAVRDVISYLVAALEQPASAAGTVEIGGPDVLQYQEMMLRYAAIRGNSRQDRDPFRFSAHACRRAAIPLVTPIPASIAQPLVEGLFNEVVVRDGAAAALFPAITPIGYDRAVRRALDRYAETRRPERVDAEPRLLEQLLQVAKQQAIGSRRTSMILAFGSMRLMSPMWRKLLAFCR